MLSPEGTKHLGLVDSIHHPMEGDRMHGGLAANRSAGVHPLFSVAPTCADMCHGLIEATDAIAALLIIADSPARSTRSVVYGLNGNGPPMHRWAVLLR